MSRTTVSCLECLLATCLRLPHGQRNGGRPTIDLQKQVLITIESTDYWLKIPFQHKHKFLKIPLRSTATSMTVYIKLKLHASDNTSSTIVLIILGIRREKLLHSWSEAALFRLIQEQMNFNRNLQPVAISPPPGDISSASNEISL